MGSEGFPGWGVPQRFLPREKALVSCEGRCWSREVGKGLPARRGRVPPPSTFGFKSLGTARPWVPWRKRARPPAYHLVAWPPQGSRSLIMMYCVTAGSQLTNPHWFTTSI